MEKATPKAQPGAGINKEAVGLKEKALSYAVYEKILIVDCVLALIHLIFYFILATQNLMLVMILGVRVPRVVLHFLAKREGEQKWI